MGIKCFVNDELKQDGNTKDMIFSVGEILEFVSSIMTLLPGDVVLTGTPEGVSKVQPGDEIKIEIETIGTCLLYTSPSPRDRTRSRMPSSA